MLDTKRRSQRHRPLVVEELEPRVLFSSDVAALAAAAGASAATSQTVPTTSEALQAAVVSAQTASQTSAQTSAQASSQTTPDATTSATTSSTTDTADAANTAQAASATTAAATQRVELVFVDSAVTNAAQLIKDLQAQVGDGRTLVVYTIDAQHDGLKQITDVLSHYQGNQAVDAIHLITHGDAQGLQIGSTWLSEQNLADYAAQIASWSQSLHAHADLMLYGCDLASSAAGRQLADDLGLLTGADVAASTNVTGNAAARGDWTLEYTHGLIESHVAANAFTQADWTGTLLLTGSGGESLVNTTTSGTQTTVTNRQVATDASGNYVVVWQTGNTLYGQRFSSTGTKLGSEFKMSTSGGLFTTVSNPQVAMNDSGAYVVSWYEYNPGILGLILPSWTVYMQRFNAAGTSQGVTQVFNNLSLLSFSGDPQMYPSVSMDNSGNIAVVTRDGSEVDIEWYNASGSETGSARVDSGNGNTKDQVSVAMTAAGTVVTWTESGTEIYGQLYNASHGAVGGNFHVNTTTSGNQTQSSVGMDSTGAFVVSWTGTQGGTNDIFAQRFSNTGAKVGSEFQVNTTSTDSQVASSISVDASGAFLIAWQSNLQDGSSTGIYVRQYQADGFAGLYDQLVNTTTTNAQSTPSVAFKGTQAVVVWNGNGTGDASGIFAQRFTVGPNQAPTATLGGTNLSYIENAGSVVLDSGLTVADADNSTLQGATIQITGNYVNGQDVLQFTNANGITGVWNATTGTLTLSGVALKATYQQALRSITYLNNSDDPSSAVRTVSIAVTDGELSSTVVTKTITVVPVNDAPTISAPAVITAVQGTPTAVTGISIADPDAESGLLTLTFTAAAGTFDATSTGAVTVSGGGSGALTLTGQLADLNNFIAAGNVSYTSANAGAVAFGINVNDGGNTGTGGPKTATFNGALSTVAVTPPTVSAPGSINVIEDQPSTVTGVTVTANDAASNPVQLTLTAGSGTLSAVSGGNVTVSQPQGDTLVLVGSAADLNAFIAGGQVSYLTASNANGSVALNVALDDLQASYPGINLYSNTSSSLAITAVNDAPQGTDGTVTALEDHSYVFNASDFGFSDPSDSPANQLAGVLITTLPTAGTLTLDVNGVTTAVTQGQLISRADLDAGNLVFKPATSANGTGYASFTFQVKDDGGTANGGVDTDPTARTLTINVTPVNDAPQGANNSVTLIEDGSYTFSVSDFGFSDPNDTPSNALLGVYVSSLPSAGTLTLSGVAVQSGDFISAANLGNLVYRPEANGAGAAHASFTFQVRDDGGTANGGIDTDQTPRTMTLNVTPVNDAPQASDGTVSTLQGSPYVFKVSDFGFSDVNDNPANSLLAVRIVSLPTAGTLTLAGAPVAASQIIQASDITAGLLVFTPKGDDHGQAYASLRFQVQDDGGTANGGVDWDSNVHTLTVNVLTSTGGTQPTTLPPLVDTQVAESAPVARAVVTAAPVQAAMPNDTSNGGGRFDEFTVRSFQVNVSDAAITVDTSAGRATSTSYDGEWVASSGGVTPIQWLLDQIQAQRLARSDGAFSNAVPDALRWNPAETEQQRLHGVAAAVKSGGVAASVGVVWWATRITGLMTGLMASTPVWRTLDPLPVLGKSGEGPDEGAGNGPDEDDDGFAGDGSEDERVDERDDYQPRRPLVVQPANAADLFAQAGDARGNPISGGSL